LFHDRLTEQEEEEVVVEEETQEFMYRKETQRLRNLKCKIVPVITGATGIVTKGLRKNSEAIPGKHSIDSLQRQLCLKRHTQYRK
jgi:hypothetical protein